ncbi:hypothetical protein F4778DRAFT_79274 [Xylariomycetidae sp. FL2044]|nr:hypothetical protein F4778DRAFT_79274 [Xylariomycetidae sp. FL2044]
MGRTNLLPSASITFLSLSAYVLRSCGNCEEVPKQKAVWIQKLYCAKGILGGNIVPLYLQVATEDASLDQRDRHTINGHAKETKNTITIVVLVRCCMWVRHASRVVVCPRREEHRIP